MKGRAVRTRLDGTVDKAADVGLVNWRMEPTHAGFGPARVRFTVDDPKAYTKAFDIALTLEFQDTDLLEAMREQRSPVGQAR